MSVYILKRFKYSPRINRDDHKPRFGEGKEVQARVQGSKKYHNAMIRADNGDGTYEIQFDNGTCGSSVPKACIKLKRESSVQAGNRCVDAALR